jgi:hypothetical protein
LLRNSHDLPWFSWFLDVIEFIVMILCVLHCNPLLAFPSTNLSSKAALYFFTNVPYLLQCVVWTLLIGNANYLCIHHAYSNFGTQYVSVPAAALAAPRPVCVGENALLETSALPRAQSRALGKNTLCRGLVPWVLGKLNLCRGPRPSAN